MPEVIDLEAVRAAKRLKAVIRLLAACIGVRRAIDEECDANGNFSSSDPEYDRKSARFDALHREEAQAWSELKPLLP